MSKQKVYRIVSALLQYPEKEWLDEIDALKEELGGLPDGAVRPLAKFIAYLEKTPYEDLCQNYVYTFDFYERGTLYLTHSVFKDNRERGSVLIKLREGLYEAGYELLTEELPDYLPLILEYCSIVPAETGEKLLKLHFRPIQNLQLELQGIASPYGFLLDACVHCIQAEECDQEKVS